MKKLELPKIPFEKIGALSRVHRILICAATFLLLMVGFYFLIYAPKSEEITRLSGEYSRLQGELAKAKEQTRTLARLEKEFKAAEIEFKKARRLLPDKKEISQLLEGVTMAGQSVGLEFLLFKPEQEVVKGFYAEIPVTIKVNGSYHNTALFFDKVSKLPRIVNIFNIKIKGEKKSYMLTTSCIAKTYRFIEGSDAASSKGKNTKQ
ncbi:MAG: type 4a pilus biogenesis protein PilO [Deltaproteobacteria bacterium]|nr:type 4a pilus biogenesis protein PilO [Deltaproteobacteria bacterium]